MEDKEMLNDEELEKVNGGIAFEGQEYDSVQLLDEWIDAMNSGDYMRFANIYEIILANRSQFLADIENAGRTIPDVLREKFYLGGNSIKTIK